MTSPGYLQERPAPAQTFPSGDEAGRTAFDDVADDAVGATATLTFDVTEKGEPVNLQVEKTSDNSRASEVTAALRKWRFIPASKDGVPISVSCTMEFVRGTI